MRFWLAFFTTIVIAYSCKQNTAIEKKQSILDSTKIVLQVKLNELKRADQNLQNSGYAKFEIYRTFLKSKIEDTVSKYDASLIQQFLISGKAIEDFNSSNQDIIKHTELTISQISKLSNDIKNNHFNENAVNAYFVSETKQSEELIRIIENNIKVFNVNLNNYRNSLSPTEEYIKKINRGILPTLVEAQN